MAERSVDGAVDLDYAPSGLTWRLTCPAASALEPCECEQIAGETENRTGSAIRRSTRKGDQSLFSPHRRLCAPG